MKQWTTQGLLYVGYDWTRKFQLNNADSNVMSGRRIAGVFAESLTFSNVRCFAPGICNPQQLGRDGSFPFPLPSLRWARRNVSSSPPPVSTFQS